MTYQFRPYVFNGCDYEYIPGGEWFNQSLEDGFKILEAVAENGADVKIIALDEDENEIEERFFEVKKGKMVEV